MGNRREFEVKTFSEQTAAVGNGALEDIGDPVLLESNYPDLYFEVFNDGVALQDFAVLGQVHADSSVWHTIISGTTDFQDDTIEMHPWGSGDGDIPTLADAATMAARFKVGALYKIKFQGRAASGTTNVIVRGNAWRNA